MGENTVHPLSITAKTLANHELVTFIKRLRTKTTSLKMCHKITVIYHFFPPFLILLEEAADISEITKQAVGVS